LQERGTFAKGAINAIACLLWLKSQDTLAPLARAFASLNFVLHVPVLEQP
jgi:hypothetical protein